MPPIQIKQHEGLLEHRRHATNADRASSSRASSQASSSTDQSQVRQQQTSTHSPSLWPRTPRWDTYGGVDQHSHDTTALHPPARLKPASRSRSTPTIPSLDLALASDLTAPPIPHRAAPPIPPLSNRRQESEKTSKSCSECRKCCEPAASSGGGSESQKELLTEETIRSLVDSVQLLCQQVGSLMDERNRNGRENLMK